MTAFQNITCDSADFEQLRSRNCVYVDKTAWIHRIAASTAYQSHFISRPRRFGKSLLCSTFKVLFQGRKDLFTGLAIEQLPWDWEQETRPVVFITMPAVPDVATFSELFADIIQEKKEELNLSFDSSPAPAVMLRKLIKAAARLADDGRIAVIIDEYDAPLLHVSREERAQMKKLLASIYGQLKDCAENIRFIFITGITKFSKVSVFSQLNNFEDMSLKPEYADLLGYTHEELTTCFSPYIEEMARTLGMTAESCTRELVRWYDGFRFTEKDTQIFNPFSLANVLVDKHFNAYWASSGTPTFLVDEMKARNWLPKFSYGDTACALEDFDFFDLEAASPEMLMFQAGYLTIRDIVGKEAFLDFPNKEVRAAMIRSFYAYLYAGNTLRVNTYAEDIRKAAAMDDLPRLVALLKSHLDSIPFSDTEYIRKYEGFYQAIITTILQMACCQMDAHQQGNLGIQDAAVYSASAIYIFELKVDGSPKQAIQQCIDKNYAGKYLRDGRKIFLVGLTCNSQNRTIDTENYCVQEVAASH